MGFKPTGFTGRPVEVACDATTGLHLQNPESMTQDLAGLAGVDLPAEQAGEVESTQYGVPFVCAYHIMAHADAGGDTITVAVMDPAGTAGTPNGPAPFLFRVLKWWTRAGGIASDPEGLLTINHLSSASAANAMSEASFDLNRDEDILAWSASGTGKLIDPYDLVDEGEGIQLSMVLGANEESDFTIFFECMRVTA